MDEEQIKEWCNSNKIYSYTIIDNYFVGLFRVIYGVRVRAGLIGSLSCDIDVCAGPNDTFIYSILDMYVKKARQNETEGKPILDGLKTMSNIKPVFNDEEYMTWFTGLVNELDEEVSDE